ncbi:hypothetical protein HK104_010744 [Borealophlyctis nickersoniae]|nr:hypothetical protein HK104_010744 [Borealophlyctis nickersoniae]
MPDDIIVQFREQPLFPDYAPEPFREVSGEEDEMVETHKRFVEKLKESPYYLELPPPKPDIERYSDKFKRSRARALQKSLTTIPTDLSFFPDELHSVKDTSKVKLGHKMFKKEVDLKALDALAKEEAEGGKGKKMEGDAEDDEDAPLEEEYDEEMEEEDNDYVFNYSDEDYEGGGGGGDSDGDGGEY